MRARPVRIMVEDANKRRRLLMRAKDLKKVQGLANIYISSDLMRVQQEEDFRMRRERRGRWWQERRAEKGVEIGEGRWGKKKGKQWKLGVVRQLGQKRGWQGRGIVVGPGKEK